MTPIGSGYGRVSIFPPVIKILLIINVAVLFVETFFFPNFTVSGVRLDHWFSAWFALQPINGFNYGPFEASFWPWQLISYQFMHGGFFHLLFNMFALWMFGSELESMWGSKRFLIFYLLCGIGAGLAQLFVAPLLTGTGPTVGASGSIYGVLVGFAVMFPRRPIMMFPFFIPVPAAILVAIFIGIEMLSGISGRDGIAHLAHLGGALFGFILVKFGDRLRIYSFFEKLMGGSSGGSRRFEEYSGVYEEKAPRINRIRWERKVKDKQEQEAPKQYTSSRTFLIGGEEVTQEKIDEILDKISETGYQNLTEKEKFILNEISKKL